MIVFIKYEQNQLRLFTSLKSTTNMYLVTCMYSLFIKSIYIYLNKKLHHLFVLDTLKNKMIFLNSWDQNITEKECSVKC